MYISSLSLENFRNFIKLDMQLPPGLVIFYGDNAQGKTNLLESFYMLATSKSPRTGSEKELVNWNVDVISNIIVATRISADVHKANEIKQIDLVLESRKNDRENIGESVFIEKHIKVNGLPRRASDLFGQLRVVMFTPQDTDIISGAPSLRRRYLDLTNSQLDHTYLRNLQQYGKVLFQRNHLLRLIREHNAGPDELGFWDIELISSGAYLMAQRQISLAAITSIAEEIHLGLTRGSETLEVKYIASFNVSQQQTIADAFRKELTGVKKEEITRGVTLIGPHRDDLQFIVNGINMGIYGSRGQQRTIALSIKLAEASFMLNRTGDPPVLLLDDVLSELDSNRRRQLLERIFSYQQTIITTTDLDHMEQNVMDLAHKYSVRNGVVYT
ncbi:MAG: DNA replication/repair protein RecF [Chloroflexi bacterium]|nr:DNA replication/repair protein RecF [Chloroflexota bacterium]